MAPGACVWPLSLGSAHNEKLPDVLQPIPSSPFPCSQKSTQPSELTLRRQTSCVLLATREREERDLCEGTEFTQRNLQTSLASPAYMPITCF